MRLTKPLEFGGFLIRRTIDSQTPDVFYFVLSSDTIEYSLDQG